ncbi:hypothetical protein SprV_0602138000 [Sparganum proliferum]
MWRVKYLLYPDKLRRFIHLRSSSELLSDGLESKGQLNEKITAFYCETPEEPCTLYDVYGRPNCPRNFKRHVLCVQACQFVAKVEQSTETSFKLCRDVQQRCITIEKKNGTFNGFRKCIFQCDGWVKLENTKEYTAYLQAATANKATTSPRGMKQAHFTD